jgi:PAS domain S-box-containing protein
MLRLKSLRDVIDADPYQFFSRKDQVRENIRKLDDPSKESPINFESLLKRKSGNQFPAEIYVTRSSFRGESAIQVLVWEITDRIAIEQQRELLVNVIENSKEIVISATEEGRILYVNSPIEDILGYKQEEIIGKNMTTLAAPGYEQTYKNLIKSIPSIGKTTTEGIRRHKDGSLVPVLVTLSAIEDSDLEQVLINEIVVDLSNLKRLEASLKGRSFELEALNKVISAGFLARNMDELLDFTLTTVLNSLDYDGGAIFLIDEQNEKANIKRSLGMSNQFVQQAASLSIKSKAFKKLFIDGKTIHVDNYMKRSDGHEEYGIHTLIGVPFFSKQKVIGGLFLSTKEERLISKEDVFTLEAIGQEMGTAIAKMFAEEELIHSQELLQNVFDTLIEFFVIFDSKTGDILTTNEKFQKKIGYSNKELLKLNISDLIATDKDSFKKLMQNISSGNEKKTKLKLEHKNKEQIEFEFKFDLGKTSNKTVIIARGK